MVLAVVLMASSCAGPTTGEPTQVVESLFRAYEAGDCAAAREVVLSPTDLDCTVVSESKGLLAGEGIDLDDVTFAAGDIIGTSATVEVSWAADDVEVVEVERVDGIWLVVVDSAA